MVIASLSCLALLVLACAGARQGSTTPVDADGSARSGQVSDVRETSNDVIPGGGSAAGQSTSSDGFNDGIFPVFDPRFYGIDPGSDGAIVLDEMDRLLTESHRNFLRSAQNFEAVRKARNLDILCERQRKRAEDIPRMAEGLPDDRREAAIARFLGNTRELLACCQKPLPRDRANCVNKQEAERLVSLCSNYQGLGGNKTTHMARCCPLESEQEKLACFLTSQEKRYGGGESQNTRDALPVHKMEEAILDVCERLADNTQKNLSMSHLGSQEERTQALETWASRRVMGLGCCAKEPNERADCLLTAQQDRYVRVCQGIEPLTFGPVSTSRPELLTKRCCSQKAKQQEFCFENFRMKPVERITPELSPREQLEMDISLTQQEIQQCCTAGREFAKSLPPEVTEVTREDCIQAGEEYANTEEFTYKKCSGMFEDCCTSAGIYRRKSRLRSRDAPNGEL